MCSDEGGFRQGVAVSMTDVAVQMPQSQDVCDIGNIAIWCRQVGVIFDHMEISRQLFVSFKASTRENAFVYLFVCLFVY